MSLDEFVDLQSYFCYNGHNAKETGVAEPTVRVSEQPPQQADRTSLRLWNKIVSRADSTSLRAQSAAPTSTHPAWTHPGVPTFSTAPPPPYIKQ